MSHPSTIESPETLLPEPISSLAPAPTRSSDVRLGDVAPDAAAALLARVGHFPTPTPTPSPARRVLAAASEGVSVLVLLLPTLLFLALCWSAAFSAPAGEPAREAEVLELQIVR